MDLEKLRARYNFPSFIETHINDDGKSGMEAGFVCELCKDAVIGVHPYFGKGVVPDKQQELSAFVGCYSIFFPTSVYIWFLDIVTVIISLLLFFFQCGDQLVYFFYPGIKHCPYCEFIQIIRSCSHNNRSDGHCYHNG
jgi:hypothetical protein